MRNLFQFIVKHHNIFLFLLFEVISLVLVAQFNNYQKAKVINLSTKYAGGLYTFGSAVSHHFSLNEANIQLAEENAKLKNFLIQSEPNEYSTYIFNDSLIENDFWFIAARVINITTHKQKNYITINRGSKHGIEQGMAVTSSAGVVGSVKGVSGNFAVVIPIINLNSNVSAKIDSTGYFGTLVWDGLDYRRAQLKDIEQNAKLAIGQKIVTTGFGSYFPEGILIGTIEKFETDAEGIFFDIEVLLSTDYRQLYHVEGIKNISLNSIKELEEEETNE